MAKLSGACPQEYQARGARNGESAACLAVRSWLFCQVALYKRTSQC